MKTLEKDENGQEPKLNQINASFQQVALTASSNAILVNFLGTYSVTSFTI